MKIPDFQPSNSFGITKMPCVQRPPPDAKGDSFQRILFPPCPPFFWVLSKRSASLATPKTMGKPTENRGKNHGKIMGKMKDADKSACKQDDHMICI